MCKLFFDPGLDIKPTENPMGFIYGPGVFGPQVENRKLKDISRSLMDPNCEGPDIVYSIAMLVKMSIKNCLILCICCME